MAVRRVRRVIRKVDPWTVLKVSLIFYTVAMFAFVLGIVITWSLLQNAGVPDAVIDLINGFALFEDELVLEGGDYFRVLVFFSIVSTILLTGVTTLGAVFYNLISDIVGGIEIVVLEEVLITPPTRANGSGVRPATYAAGAGDGEEAAPRIESARQLAELPTEETSISG